MAACVPHRRPKWLGDNNCVNRRVHYYALQFGYAKKQTWGKAGQIESAQTLLDTRRPVIANLSASNDAILVRSLTTINSLRATVSSPIDIAQLEGTRSPWLLEELERPWDQIDWGYV
jgi:hypothetical protein